MNILLKTNVRLLKWFNFFLDFRPYSAIAIIYFAQVTGSYALGLAVFSVVMISSAIFEVPTGIMSDMVGRKKTIVFGALSNVFSILFYALGGGFSLLLVGGLFEGFARSLFSGNNDAFLYDTLRENRNEKEFGDVLGKVSSMFQVALAVSAVIGGFVADISLSFVMWISIVPQIICFILALKMKEPKVRTEERSGNVYSHLKEALLRFKTSYKLRYLSMASVISYGVGETAHQFTPAFIALWWPLWGLGVARGLSHVFAAFSYWFAGRIMKSTNVLKSLFRSQVATRLLGLIAVGIPSVISPLLMSFTSLFFGFSETARNTLMQREFTHQQRATMGSLNSLVGSLFFGLFAFGFGFVADNIGPTKSLFVAEVLLLSLIVIYWRMFRKTRNSKY